MKTKTLNLLADAISETGSFQGWNREGDLIQIEFCDVMLYDDTKPEKASHSSTVAVQFGGNAFAVFLDNMNNEQGTKWYDRFFTNPVEVIPVNTFELGFDDEGFARTMYDRYKNRTAVLPFEDFYTVHSVKHILAFSCEEKGLIAGGDEIRVIGKNREYTEEAIETASRRWWEYWRTYWLCRKTPQAYETDRACEMTIPADPKNLPID